MRTTVEPLPKRHWIKVLFLSVTIVLLGLLITISISHFETKRRLNVVENQQKLFINEISRMSHSGQAAEMAHQEFQRFNHQQQHRMQLSLWNRNGQKFAELEQTKSPPASRNADENERSDYALGTAGAQILSTGKTHVMMTPLPQSFALFGFSGISKFFLNGAHRAIQPSIQPGECFAFTGPGELVIKLIKTVFIDAVTVEHIPAQISPDGNILSAPGILRVYGMEMYNDPHPVHLGTFYYDITKHQSRQEFRLDLSKSGDKSFPIVKFEFDSKSDDRQHTCVYRVRVHGSLIKPN